MTEKIKHLILAKYPSGKREEFWYDDILTAQKTRDKLIASGIEAELIAWK